MSSCFPNFSQVSLKTFVQKRCQHRAVFTNKTTTNSFRKSRRRWGGMLGTRTTATLSLPRVCVLRLFGLERIGCWFLVLDHTTLCVNVPSMESEGISSQREKSKKKTSSSKHEIFQALNMHAKKKNVFIPPFAGRSATRVTGRFLLRGSFLLERMGFCGLWRVFLVKMIWLKLV